MRSWLLVTTIVLGSTLRAAAQDATPISADEARRRAVAALRDGTRPIRADLSPADVARLVVRADRDDAHGELFAVTLPATDERVACLVHVERATGLVTYVYQPGAEMIVDEWADRRTRRSEDELAGEVAARATFGPDELRERARALLAHLVPDFERRRFEQVEERRDDGRRGGIVRQTFVLAEAPAPGVLACFSNLARVVLNPETGELVAAQLTQVRFEVREAPPVAAADAERAARRALGAPERTPAGSRLWVTLDEPRRPRPVWVVRVGERAAVVCARDASVLLAR